MHVHMNETDFDRMVHASLIFLGDPRHHQPRGNVSREFHIYSRGMLDIAYIGATHLDF